MINVVVSGHRPGKLPKIAQLDTVLSEAYSRFKVDTVIQGMADGVDLIAARTAFRSNRLFIGVAPGLWHTPGYGWERDYQKAKDFAQSFEYSRMDESYPGPWAFQVRNEYMVDKLWPAHGDMVIAVWDGSPSGTANCVKYAIKKNIRVWRIDPSTFEGEYVK